MAILAIGPFIPAWQFLIILSLAKGLVVLGLMLLLRTGLVSFGQGLYYCVGAYAAGSLGQFFAITDALAMLAVGTLAAAALACVLGFLLARYRSIFFAMLSLAFSMILFGLLVKTSALGSTDGFNIAAPKLFGWPITGSASQYPLLALATIAVLIACWGLHAYLRTPLGRLAPAIRDNEIRVEYLGASVRSAIHVNYVIAGGARGSRRRADRHRRRAYRSRDGLLDDFGRIRLRRDPVGHRQRARAVPGLAGLRDHSHIRLRILAEHLADGARDRDAPGDRVPAGGAVVDVRAPRGAGLAH